MLTFVKVVALWTNLEGSLVRALAMARKGRWAVGARRARSVPESVRLYIAVTSGERVISPRQTVNLSALHCPTRDATIHDVSVY